MSTANSIGPERPRPRPTRLASSSVVPSLDLDESIRQVCRADGPLEQLGQRLVPLLASQHDVVAAVLFGRSDGAEWRQTTPIACQPEHHPVAKTWGAHLIHAVQSSATSQAVSVVQLPSTAEEEGYACVLAPLVISDDKASSVVCLVGRPQSRTEMISVARLAAAEMTAAVAARRQEAAPGNAQSADRLLQTVLTVATEGEFARGYDELAAQLRTELDCDSILLAICNRAGRRLRLQAISGVSRFQRHSRIASCAEELLNEAALVDSVQFYDDANPTPAATDAQKQLARVCNARIVVSGSIRDRSDQALGAWVILRTGLQDSVEQTAWAAQVRQAANALSSRLGPCFELMRRLRPSVLQRFSNSAFGPSSQRRRRVLLSVAFGLIGLLALPLPYNVKCDCEVQAIARRYVPVPHAGVLHDVLVEPGDVVQTGQVLARMDGREIAWELAARQAEYERAKKEHDVQLAGQHAAAAQVAKLEMERLSLQIKLLDNRASNLDIRSPIAGVVIRGDAKRKESARLNMGDTLFEIGPLKKMVVDVLVPDEDVAYVQPDQTVKIRLDAFPGSPRTGVVQRVRPQAELRGQQNVFVAEVELDNEDGSLRPGMMGRGQVRTVVRPLAWNLFHGAWDRLVYLVAW